MIIGFSAGKIVKHTFCHIYVKVHKRESPSNGNYLMYINKGIIFRIESIFEVYFISCSFRTTISLHVQN